jgi:hypothetical protein
MVSNNFFSFPRFLNVGRKMMVEHWKSHALRIILMLAVMILLIMWAGYRYYRVGVWTDLPSSDPEWDAEVPIFLISLFIFGCYSASLMMEDLRSKGGRISVLTTPSSPFENWFARWIIHIVLFLIVFLAAYFVADYLRVWIYSLAFPHLSSVIVPLGLNKVWDLATSKVDQSDMPFLGFLFVQSVYVLGSSVFPRHSLMRTSVCCFFIMVIYFFIGNIVYNKFIGTQVVIVEEMDFYRVLLIIGIVINWGLGYLRFKEMEIIDRL